MKSVFGIAIFFLIITAVVFAIRPVYSVVSKTIEQYEEKFTAGFTEYTGLCFKYQSLSPSFLKRLTIRNIEISDYSTGKAVLKVGNAALSYSIRSLLKGDIQDGFSRLILSDIEIYADNGLISRLRQLTSKDSNEDDLMKHIPGFLSKLPFDVYLKNIVFEYTSNEDVYKISVKNWSFRHEAALYSLGVKISGSFSASTKFFNYESAGFLYRIEGNFFEGLDGTSFKIRLDDFSRTKYSVRRMEYLVSCAGSSFSIRSTQKNFPYEIFVSFDAESGTFSSRIDSEKFDFLSLFRLYKKNKIISLFEGTKISTATKIDGDVKSGKIKWSTKSDFDFTKTPLLKGKKQFFSIQSSGNNRIIDFSSLEMDGDVCKAFFTGSFDIPSKVPQGFLQLDYFVLPNNGNAINADIYLEPKKTGGFNCFIPQLNLGQQFYTGIEIFCSLSASSLDFALEASEYSHMEYESPARLSASCSIALGHNPYLQASFSFGNFFLDTALISASFFTDSEKQSALLKQADAVSSMISSFDLFVSSDFKSLSFNSPMILVANTKKDREVLLLSVDGSESAVRASRFDLVYGNNSLNGNFDVDFSAGGKHTSFITEFNFNSIPYTISGSYSDTKWLSFSGSYGLDGRFALDSSFGGSLSLYSFPVSINGFIVSITLDTLIVSENSQWKADIIKFDLEELSDKFQTRPKLSLQGELNPKGLVFSSLSFSDRDSVLSGYGYSFWNFEDKLFNNASFNLSLKDLRERESVNLDIQINNPLLKKVDLNNFRSDLYFNAMLDVSGLPMSRFLVGQKENNTLSFGVNASGTFENPYILFDLRNSEVLLGGDILKARCMAQLVENRLDVSDAEISWGFVKINDIMTSIDLNEFYGNAGAKLDLKIAERKIKADLDFVLSNFSSGGNGKPEAWSLEMNCSSIESEIIKNFQPFKISIIRSPGRFDIMTDEILGSYGELLDDGTLNFMVQEDKPLHFSASGTIRNQIVNIDFNNLFMNIPYFVKPFNSGIFSVYSGELNGSLSFYGNITDPDLEGNLVVSSCDFNVPYLVPDHVEAVDMEINFSRDLISVSDMLFTVRDGCISANAIINLDHWNINTMELSIETLSGKDIPLDSKFSFFKIKGYTAVDADIIMEDKSITVNGSLSLRNTDISLSLNSVVQNSTHSKKDNGFVFPDITINMDLLVGNKVQIAINPLLRALIAPSTPIFVTADTATGLWTLKGDVVLRGGEVSYLSRNFYLKEGRLNLNESQASFDPNVTVRAEIREHDMNGEPITISLSAIRQNVSSFNAVISSTPAKSEYEIMQILGQVAMGDSSNVSNLLVAGMDYGVSVTVLRKLETALRDLCNFDIFSVRTTLIQNSIMQTLNLRPEMENRSVISNLFDNSTVYIGKYFNSDIYADALLHWTYDETRVSDDNGVSGGLVFQPEIGLELSAPFANIRCNLAPDLSDLNQSWVNAASLTLSWRVTF